MSESAVRVAAEVARRPARFGRAQLFVVVGLYSLTLLFLRDSVAVTRAQYADAPHALFSAVVAPFLGPFLGGWATAGETQLAPHAHELVAPSLTILALGLALQFAPSSMRRARLFVWTVAWTVWFGAAIVSVLQLLG